MQANGLFGRMRRCWPNRGGNGQTANGIWRFSRPVMRARFEKAPKAKTRKETEYSGQDLWSARRDKDTSAARELLLDAIGVDVVRYGATDRRVVAM